MKYLMIMILSMSLSVHAAQITPMAQGEPAQYEGYLIDKDMEKKMRKANEKVKALETIKHNQKVVIDIMKSKADYYRKQTEALQAELEKERSGKFWSSVLYFIGGAVITGGLTLGAVKLLGK